MSKQQLLELAERVERLTQSERAVDAEIACLIGKPLGDIDHWLHAADIQWEPTVNGWYLPILPDGSRGSAYASMEYTASLDSAMTLVPEGYDWVIGRTNGGLTIHAEVGGRGDEYMVFATTPALALTAASLRAKAAMIEDE